MRKHVKTYFLLFLFAVTATIWYAISHFEERQNLLVTFFDIGQGDSIFIEVPDGKQILVDGGPSVSILSKLGKILPFWDRSIDLLILTHPHADHVTGLAEVLKRYDVDAVLETGVNYSTPEYAEWRELLRKKNTPIVYAEAGMTINFAKNGRMGILLPNENLNGRSFGNVHDAMIISKLHYGSTTVLLTGDAEKLLEKRLVRSKTDLKSDVLKVGHHGSKTSTSAEFLAAVSPKISIIQSGRRNRYGHPHQDVIDRLIMAGTRILRNDLNGDIQLKSDGHSVILSKYESR